MHPQPASLVRPPCPSLERDHYFVFVLKVFQDGEGEVGGVRSASRLAAAKEAGRGRKNEGSGEVVNAARRAKEGMRGGCGRAKSNGDHAGARSIQRRNAGTLAPRPMPPSTRPRANQRKKLLRARRNRARYHIVPCTRRARSQRSANANEGQTVKVKVVDGLERRAVPISSSFLQRNTLSATDFMTLPENRVPSELLGEILKNVPEYDKSTLQSFSLTCRAFCGASRPRLFSRIEFTPYVLDEENIPLFPSLSEIARHIPRLDFLSSTEIAPLVRDFRMLVRLQQLSCGWNTSIYPDNPYVLENALFERLVRFPGLQQFHATRIDFTPARLDILFRLPHLICLGVSDCAVMPNAPFSRQLHLSDFSVHSERAGGLGDYYWFPLLHPEHLRAFGLSLGFYLRGTVLALPTFPKVHTLRADSCSDMSSWENLTFLSKFPALRHLELWTRNLGAGALFPHLEQYSGACQALSFFGGSPALRRIQTECAAPEDFLSRVHAIQGGARSEGEEQIRRKSPAEQNEKGPGDKRTAAYDVPTGSRTEAHRYRRRGAYGNEGAAVHTRCLFTLGVKS
ncbi:hypothetical protein C8R45DRAFT_1138002 [Mycena sanguinolenta]|nr:hypothetical protein C8R45DRAFT_1138002 [Mycena sanguinolenta]